MSKKVSVTVDIEVDDAVSEEHVAKEIERVVGTHVEGLLSRLQSEDEGEISIRTVAREIATGSSGYESRLWSKATC